MKVLVVVLLSVCAVLAKPADDKYTTKYDNIDLDEILKNDRLLTGYTNCLLGKGACTADAKELKNENNCFVHDVPIDAVTSTKVLPDALQNGCEKCSEKQEKASRKVIGFLITEKEGIYNELTKLYDPEGLYKVKYCRQAKEEGIDTLDKCK